MILKTLRLENFRNHQKASFDFDTTTIIIGKNTVGKTNILEAIQFLTSGKSFRAEKEMDTISSEKTFAKIEGKIENSEDTKELSVILAVKNNYFSKRFLVNKVGKRQLDFASQFYSVLFIPQDIDIISSSPNLRRKYVDTILCQADRSYRLATRIYDRSLRHRNRMLYDLRERKKNYKPIDFEYWDTILIENGKVITEKREQFVEYVNSSQKNIFEFDFYYDKSTVTPARLEKYYDAERAAAVTLVGPQRDDFKFFVPNSQKEMKEFGSRGEQRLTLLQMKVFEIEYVRIATGEIPVLLLDDIFSELDTPNIEKVFELITTQQTIITTTHKEFVPGQIIRSSKLNIIEL